MTQPSVGLQNESDRQWLVGLPSLAAILCLMLALAALGSRDLELDEAFAITSTNQLGTSLHLRAGSMALYYILLTPWAAVSIDPFWIRLLSAVFAVAAVWVTVRFALEVFGRHVGVWTAVFLVPMWGITRFAVEARAYSMVVFLAVTSWWLLIRLERRDSTLGWIAWGVCAAALIYCHPLAGLIVATQGIVTWLEHPDSRELLMRAKPGWLTLGVLMTPMLAAIAFGIEAAPDWIGPLGLHTPGEIMTIVAGPIGLAQVTVAAALVAATIGVARATNRRSSDPVLRVESWRRTCMVAWLWVPPVLLTFVSAISPLMRERYLIGSIPAAAIVLALAVSTISKRELRLGAGAVVAIALLPGLVHVQGYTTHRWGEAVSLVEADLDPEVSLGVLFASTAARHPFELTADGSPILDETIPIWPTADWGTNLRYFDEQSGTIASRLALVDIVWVVDFRTHLGRGQVRPSEWDLDEPLIDVGYCVDVSYQLSPELRVTRFDPCPDTGS